MMVAKESDTTRLILHAIRAAGKGGAFVQSHFLPQMKGGAAPQLECSTYLYCCSLPLYQAGGIGLSQFLPGLGAYGPRSNLVLSDPLSCCRRIPQQGGTGYAPARRPYRRALVRSHVEGGVERAVGGAESAMASALGVTMAEIVEFDMA